MRPILLILTVLISGCADYTKSPIGFIVAVPPSQWTQEQVAVSRSEDIFRLCAAYRAGSAYNGGRTSNYIKADFLALERILQERGLTPRDIAILRSRSATYGTNQTFEGLRCSIGYYPTLNKSFYPGTGTQWQAVLRGGDFVYLRGDGTPRGMRVFAWN